MIDVMFFDSGLRMADILIKKLGAPRADSFKEILAVLALLSKVPTQKERLSMSVGLSKGLLPAFEAADDNAKYEHAMAENDRENAKAIKAFDAYIHELLADPDKVKAGRLALFAFEAGPYRQYRPVTSAAASPAEGTPF